MRTIDELIDDRGKARAGKDWDSCDAIRDYLDRKLVFIFDAPYGQQIFYLTEKYFSKKPEGMLNRKYVEFRIQQDSESEKRFDAWLFTVNATRHKPN